MTIGPGVVGGATFSLTKEWWDPTPGIDLVELHVAWGAEGSDPAWDDGECAVMTPRGDEERGRRTAAIDVPRTVAGSPEFLLHHRFFVVGPEGRVVSPVVTERVTSKELRFVDEHARWTHVGLLWTVGTSDQPNYTLTTLDGLPPEPPEAHPTETFAPRFAAVQALPTPHVFRGRVWGLAGQDVTGVFHLVRAGSEDDAEIWLDNAGQGWRMTLD